MKLYGSLKELVSAVFRKNSQEITLRPNQATTYTSSRDVQLPPQDANGVLVSADSTQTITNKVLSGNTASTLINGSGTLSINSSGTVTVPNATDTLVAKATTDILTNKTINGASNTLTVLAATQLSGQVPTANGGTGVNSTATFPTSGVVVTEAATETLTNKTLDNTNTITVKDTLFTLQDNGDITKQARFELSSIGTGNTRTYTLPNNSDTVVLEAFTQTLSGKTLDQPNVTTQITMANRAETRYYETTANGTNYMALRAPTAVTANTTLSLPDGDGTSGQVLSTNGSAQLQWASAATVPAEGSVYSNGTALQTTGSFSGNANKVVGVNSGATATEYKSLATGTSGTDFAIAHTSGTVTFNLPDASASNRGAVTTGTQTFGGTKTFSAAVITGDLTVDTNTLKVDSTNNRVGIGIASPTSQLHNYIATGDVSTTTESDGTDSVVAYVLSNDTVTWVVRNNGGNSDAFEIRDATSNAQRVVISASTGGVAIQGTNSTDTAAAGYVGEFVSNTGAGGSLTSGQFRDAGTITLSAGCWDISGGVTFSPAATTNVTRFQGGIGTVTGNDSTGLTNAQSSFIVSQAASIPGNDVVYTTPVFRVNLSGSTTYYMKARMDFTVSTASASGYIRATRIR